MTDEELYAIWAPHYSDWSPWVKPILFAYAANLNPSLTAPYAETAITLPGSLPLDNGKTALILDLPSGMGVVFGINFAYKLRYRPIPLYNSCPAPATPSAEYNPSFTAANMAINVHPILDALRDGARDLHRMNLPPSATPTFLLDSNRRHGETSYRKLPGTFDNRSVSLPTDFPSANFLLNRGIQTVILIQQNRLEPQEDLSHTLLRWQLAGIQILAKSLADDAPPAPIRVRRPNLFRISWYTFIAALGLRPTTLGGFGGLLPVPSSG